MNVCPGIKLFFVLLIFSALRCPAQNDTVTPPRIKPERGSWTQHHALVSFGIGNYNINPYNFYNINQAAPGASTLTNLTGTVIHAKAEFAFDENIGVGLSINQSRINYNTTYQPVNGQGQMPTLQTDQVFLKIFVLNCRVNYHFLHAELFDPYIGLGAGFRTYNYEGARFIEKVFVPKLPFGYELTLGLRYLVASRVGVYAEAGFGSSVYQAGLSINVGKLR